LINIELIPGRYMKHLPLGKLQKVV